MLKPPPEGLKLVELRIVDSLDEELSKYEGDIILGPNKILAYIQKKNCILMVKPKDGTTDQSATFGRLLGKDVHRITGPLKLKELYITKTELFKLSGGHRQNNINNMKKKLNEMFKNMNIKINVLKELIRITDPGMKKLLLNDYHILPTSGHAGINRMIKNIKTKYYWTGMQEDVTTFVKHCELCQKNKHINMRKQPMVITSTSETSFEKIYIDLVGPLDETIDGYKYILTIQDELTKFVENIPLKNKEANTVAEGLVTQFILKYGVPKKIASDQGTEFMSNVFKDMCKMLKIEQMFSTAYHHESIGALENSHKVLGSYLRTYVAENHTDWDKWVPYYTFCYNTAVHSETEYTPYELVYGKQCNLPSSLTKTIQPVYNYEDYNIDLKNKLQIAHRDAREILGKKKQDRKDRFDKDNRVKDSLYEVGSLVLLKNENRKKLDPIYIGPYEVIDNKGVNCEIKTDKKKLVVHKNRLKPFYIYLMLLSS